MDQIVKTFGILISVFLILELLALIMPRFPRIPGDIYFDKSGIRIYIPFVSAIALSVVISLLLHSLGK